MGVLSLPTGEGWGGASKVSPTGGDLEGAPFLLQNIPEEQGVADDIATPHAAWFRT